MAGESKQLFSGSVTTVISLSAALASGANTYTGLGGLTNTQLDNSALGYLKAVAVLSIPDTFAAAPTAGGTVDLYMIHDDLDGTSDETPEPGATDIDYLGRYMGSFVVDNQDVAHLKCLVIDLEGVRKARFFIKNSSGQQISYTSSPTTVKIELYTYAPT